MATAVRPAVTADRARVPNGYGGTSGSNGYGGSSNDPPGGYGGSSGPVANNDTSFNRHGLHACRRPIPDDSGPAHQRPTRGGLTVQAVNGQADQFLSTNHGTLAWGSDG